jgi:hypothetical protein
LEFRVYAGQTVLPPFSLPRLQKVEPAAPEDSQTRLKAELQTEDSPTRLKAILRTHDERTAPPPDGAWFNIAWVRVTLARLTIRTVMVVNACSAIVYVRCRMVSVGDDCYPVLNQA